MGMTKYGEFTLKELYLFRNLLELYLENIAIDEQNIAIDDQTAKNLFQEISEEIREEENG